MDIINKEARGACDNLRARFEAAKAELSAVQHEAGKMGVTAIYHYPSGFGPDPAKIVLKMSINI